MTALVADSACEAHDSGPGHPESCERFGAVLDGLESAELVSRLSRLAPILPTHADLLAVHTEHYLWLAQEEIEQGDEQLSTGDTMIGPESWKAALAAAGSACAAVDAVVRGEVENAFCVVRPPGHHAGPGRGMGFCILNNVALAARRAQRSHGIERVLIVDWDVHHGNGTQDVFYDDGSVFFFSTHQAPLYPGTGRAGETGAGAGVGSTLNCPFPAGSGRAEILGAFEKKLLPAMETFRPELVLISAGFDSRVGDPLGEFRLTDEDFYDLTKLLKGLAKKHAGGRIVSALEGGYSLAGLAAGAAAHVRGLLG